MRTIKHLRWWIIGLVTLGTILNYLAGSVRRNAPVGWDGALA